MTEETINEIWKDIEGYDGKYQISNLGRVRSLDRIVNGKGGGKRFREGKLLKSKKKYNGYMSVSLYKDRKYNYKLVHRLVCESFLPNPENKPCVDHINTIKDDNRVENLRWVNNKENMNNPLTLKKINESEAIKRGFWKGCYGKDNPRSIPIIQLSLDGEIVRYWISAAVCNRETGYSKSHIGQVCKDIRTQSYGYKWKYVDDYLADWWDKEYMS